MNVMQAFDKINELRDKIRSLESAMMRLDSHDQGSEIRMLEEIKEGFEKERDELSNRLEKN